MSQHTPGPWVIDEFLESAGIYKIRAEDSALCLIHSIAEHGPDERSTADARLIAAAPDLYQAALLAASVLGHMANTLGHTPEEGTVLPILRDALAKAEGR